MSKISTGNTGEGKSCCDVVKVNSSDELASYLANKLTAGRYVILTVKDGVEGSTIEITLDTSALSGQISSSDQLVKASSTDTNAANYLFNKLTHASPANGTILVKKNPAGTLVYFELDAGIENLNDVTLSAMAAGQILRWDEAYSKWVNDYSIEGTFSGTSTKIPASSALKTFLQALTITDATDCGASGNSIMYKTKDINIYGMPISVVAWTAADVFTNHLPNAVPDPDILSNQVIDPYGFRNKRYVSIKSIESSPQGAGDGYAYAFANFTLDEDWDAGDGSGIRARLFVASREDAPNAKQARVRVEYTIFDTDNNYVISSGTQNVLWDLGDSIIKEVDYPLTLTGLTAGKPLNVFLAISIASDLYTPETDYTMYDEVGITGARIIYLTKTINLRDADIDL